MHVSPTADAAFVYGTLQLPEVLVEVLGRVPTKSAASLEGYRSARLRGLAYPGMLSAPGQRVPGLVLQQLAGEDWLRLDDYEGELYERQQVSVWAEGRHMAAQTYVLRAEFSALMTDVPWSLEEFAQRELGPFLAELRHPRSSVGPL